MFGGGRLAVTVVRDLVWCRSSVILRVGSKASQVPIFELVYPLANRDAFVYSNLIEWIDCYGVNSRCKQVSISVG